MCIQKEKEKEKEKENENERKVCVWWWWWWWGVCAGVCALKKCVKPGDHRPIRV